MHRSTLIRHFRKVLANLEAGAVIAGTVTKIHTHNRLISAVNCTRNSPVMRPTMNLLLASKVCANTARVRLSACEEFQSESPPGSSSDRPWMLMAFLPAAFFGLWKTEEDEMSVEDKILMDIKRAILSIKRDQIEKAEKYLARALSKSQEEKLEHAISQILDIQANLALQKGELDKAEHLLKLTAQRLTGLQGYAVNDNAIIEMSIKLSEIYDRTGHFDKAISGYEYCIKAQKEKIRKNELEDDEKLKTDTLLLLAWALHSLGQLHMKIAVSPGLEKSDRNAHISAATMLSTDAYKYATEAEGPESQHAVTVRSDLATIEALTGDIDSALRIFHEVESIAKEKHADLYPNISVNIGNLYMQKGLYEEAVRICQEAKAFAGKMNDTQAFDRAQECIIKCGKLRGQKKSNDEELRSKGQAEQLHT